MLKKSTHHEGSFIATTKINSFFRRSPMSPKRGEMNPLITSPNPDLPMAFAYRLGIQIRTPAIGIGRTSGELYQKHHHGFRHLDAAALIHRALFHQCITVTGAARNNGQALRPK